MPGQGPSYFVNIEGAERPWDSPTITVAQIVELGGWDLSQGVLEIDLKTNQQRTLAADELVELKPGQGFAKKHLFKRGGDDE